MYFCWMNISCVQKMEQEDLEDFMWGKDGYKILLTAIMAFHNLKTRVKITTYWATHFGHFISFSLRHVLFKACFVFVWHQDVYPSLRCIPETRRPPYAIKYLEVKKGARPSATTTLTLLRLLDIVTHINHITYSTTTNKQTMWERGREVGIQLVFCHWWTLQWRHNGRLKSSASWLFT